MVLRRFVPLLPGSLVVALAGILVTRCSRLEDHGLEIVGHIDSGLPSVGLPDVSWSDFPALLGGSVGVMLVGFAEGLGAAKTYAAKERLRRRRQPRAARARRLPTSGAGLASGMVVNGTPVQDRRQRLRRGALAGLRA